MAEKQDTLVLLCGNAVTADIAAGFAGVANIVRADDLAVAQEYICGPAPVVFLVDLGQHNVETVAALTDRANAACFEAASPVIAIVANGDKASELSALNAGAADVLTQPLDADIAYARIGAQVASHRLRLRLVHKATIDALTNLPNRRVFDERLAAEFARHRRQHQWLTISLIDVDHFKQVNDRFGHTHGDICLQRIANSLAFSAKRSGEVIARYGGEEFAGIHPNVDEFEAQRYGDRVCQKIADANFCPVDDEGNPVTVSIGICSVIPSGKFSPEDLVEWADQALYAAKRGGRNRCVMYHGRGETSVMPAVSYLRAAQHKR